MADLIPEAMARLRLQLRPATEREMAVAIAGLLDFARAFNVPHDHAESAARIYAAALATMPYDLLRQAISGVIATHKWGMRLPLPAEISAQVSEEVSRRRSTLARLEMAKRAPVEREDTRPPPTDDEKRQVDAFMAKWRGERSDGDDGSVVAPDAQRLADLLGVG